MKLIGFTYFLPSGYLYQSHMSICWRAAGVDRINIYRTFRFISTGCFTTLEHGVLSSPKPRTALRGNDMHLVLAGHVECKLKILSAQCKDSRNCNSWPRLLRSIYLLCDQTQSSGTDSLSINRVMLFLIEKESHLQKLMFSLFSRSE